MRREPLFRRRLTILDALDDPNIFAHAFQNAASWSSWRTFLACLFGLPLSEEQRELFKQCTGRQKPTADECNEAWLVIGRRGGKSFAFAAELVHANVDVIVTAGGDAVNAAQQATRVAARD